MRKKRKNDEFKIKKEKKLWKNEVEEKKERNYKKKLREKNERKLNVDLYASACRNT